jgi:phosphorylcholine metabolism protein LicD
MESKKEYRFSFIDIFVFEYKDSRKLYHRSEKTFSKHYTKEIVMKKEWEEVIEMRFGDLDLKALKEPENFCLRVYGDGWKSYTYCFRNHLNRKLVNPRNSYLRCIQ